jgi:hypothetical protein
MFFFPLRWKSSVSMNGSGHAAQDEGLQSGMKKADRTTRIRSEKNRITMREGNR